MNERSSASANATRDPGRQHQIQPDDWTRRVKELVPPDAAFWPTLPDMQRITATAAELAELLTLMPGSEVLGNGDDASERAYMRLAIEEAVRALARLFNPFAYPLEEAPLAIVYRGWPDVLRVHHAKLHRALKEVVGHFGFGDLYEGRSVTGPYDPALGPPPADLMGRLEESAQRIANGLAAAEEVPSPQRAAGHEGKTGGRSKLDPVHEARPERDEKQADILKALAVLKAAGVRRRVSRQEAAAKVDPAANPRSYFKAIAALVREGLVRSRSGPNGGIWLTPQGVAATPPLAPTPLV